VFFTFVLCVRIGGLSHEDCLLCARRRLWPGKDARAVEYIGENGVNNSSKELKFQ
jgi:hypothetical protein